MRKARQNLRGSSCRRLASGARLQPSSYRRRLRTGRAWIWIRPALMRRQTLSRSMGQSPRVRNDLASKIAFDDLSQGGTQLSFTMGDQGDTPGPFKFVTDGAFDLAPNGTVTATGTVYGFDENTQAYATFNGTPHAPVTFSMDANNHHSAPNLPFGVRREKLAPPRPSLPVAQSHPCSKVRRRSRGNQIASSSRCRLVPAVTKIRR